MDIYIGSLGNEPRQGRTGHHRSLHSPPPWHLGSFSLEAFMPPVPGAPGGSLLVWAYWQPKKLPLAQEIPPFRAVTSSQLEFPLPHSVPLGLTQAGESRHARLFEVGAPLGLQAPCLQRGSE